MTRRATMLASAACLLPVILFSRTAGAQSEQPAIDRAAGMRLVSRRAGPHYVTRTEVAHALRVAAQTIIANRWAAQPAIPPRRAVTEGTDWRTRPVTLGQFSETLLRFGDMLAIALPKSTRDSTQLAASQLIGQLPGERAARLGKRRRDAEWLVGHKMLAPGSPLLMPGDAPVTAGALARLLSLLALGIINQVTSLGRDRLGNSIDVNSPRGKP